ncbi:MAG: RNase adapter RapZ [Acidimicrobiia bacterium]|nr:RNase adapter RapZ [Acidimicrobiia bacterium]
MSEFLLITGMSGAGGSTAANTLEDLGWFVIDNLPSSLIAKVSELAQAPGSTTDRVALVVRPRTDLRDLVEALTTLRDTADRVRVLFLDAADSVLVRRYEATRRRHPMAEGSGVAATIRRERAVLEPLKEEADVLVDTSDMNVHGLRDRILALFGSEASTGGMQVSVVSFGYKHGLPLDVDVVLDCRFLPNPNWVDELRPLTGRDAPVRDYVLGFPQTGAFLQQLEDLLDLLLPAYVEEGKAYLSLALGCTGGRHRSVAIAEEVASALRRKGFDPRVQHRDVDR